MLKMFPKSLLCVAVATLAVAKVQYMGMNIPGFEFGCLIDGTCPLGSVVPPLSSLGGGDGAGQMQHFAKDDGMNIFRMSVSWQYLVNNQLGGQLDPTNFGKYDQLMQACLATGAYCAIDFHNFARYNGLIIGQGGPTDAQFADIWAQLSGKYKTNPKVVFGLMNEPHDVDITTWANSCQAAVTAIRNGGATSQMILLPGNNFASAGEFVSSGSGAALIGIKNPDGSNTGLILDVHKYLDVDNSGTHSECTTDNIADAFAIVATFLRQNGRLALVSETGAASSASCFTDFCAQNTYLNQNSDVFIGYIAWGAGSFAPSYLDSLTPTKKNGKYVDNALASQCVIGPWVSAGSATFVSSAGAVSTGQAISTGGAPSGTTTGAGPSKTGKPTKTKDKTSATTLTTTISEGCPCEGSSTLTATGSTPQATGSPTTSGTAQFTGGADVRSLAGGLLVGGLLAAVLL